MNSRGIRFAAAIVLAWASLAASADVIVNYVVDAGGNNSDPLNGLSARGTFRIDGTTLTVLLENTSSGVPLSFDVADSLLVSVGFDLPGATEIDSGDAAVIGLNSVGLGQWATRGPGQSVGEEWIWTNDFGGDLLQNFAQIISTSAGQGGGTVTRFDGGSGTVSGPFGGIAADPPHRTVPNRQRAVSDSIEFTLTLSGTINEQQLREFAEASLVEFGSDARYLSTPEPGTFLLIAAGALLTFGRRQRRQG